METYRLTFKAYWRDQNKDGLPVFSGVYWVYKCRYMPDEKKVLLLQLLYIGQAGNIKERIVNHDKRNIFLAQIKDDEELCYAYAYVDSDKLDIVENALIFAEKPPLNEQGKDYYRYDAARFIIDGDCHLIKNRFFQIS